MYPGHSDVWQGSFHYYTIIHGLNHLSQKAKKNLFHSINGAMTAFIFFLRVELWLQLQEHNSCLIACIIFHFLYLEVISHKTNNTKWTAALAELPNCKSSSLMLRIVSLYDCTPGEQILQKISELQVGWKTEVDNILVKASNFITMMIIPFRIVKSHTYWLQPIR